MQRRTILLALPGALGLAQAAPGGRVYFGTYTRGISKGIYTAAFNERTGELSAPELAAEARNASFLIPGRGPGKGCLYAVSETPQGRVMAYRRRPDQTLDLIGEVSSEGAAPCHLDLNPLGTHLAVANYSSGSFVSYRVKPDGSLSAAVTVMSHEGKSLNPRRQEGPHAHSANFFDEGRLALCCDLGTDQVRVYGVGRDARLTLQRYIAVPPGSGPRHLVRQRGTLYVLSELTSNIHVLPWTPDPKLAQTITTLPAGFAGNNTTAELLPHPNGKFLYASNRGHNSIAAFGIDGAGRLQALGHFSCGKTPRSFAIHRSGNWLITAHQDADSAQVFAVDPRTGALTAKGAPVTVGAPVCVQFTA